MPTADTLERFIARVEQNAHAEAVEELYFEWQDGTTTHMEELAYQRWEGERIAEETSLYDPAQRIRKKP